jgi:hypothetical protein
MEKLSTVWGKFTLDEEENVGFSLDISEIDPLVTQGKTCLVGKLVTDRIIPKEFYKAPLTCVWQSMGEITFNVIGENMFIVEFEYEWD